MNLFAAIATGMFGLLAFIWHHDDWLNWILKLAFTVLFVWGLVVTLVAYGVISIR